MEVPQESNEYENGASLAEQEYGAEIAPPRNVGSMDSQDLERNRETEIWKSIEALRSEIAADTLLQDTPYLSFTSPFEVPRGAVQDLENRYLEVPMVYCDQTASNRPVKSIEKYMEEVCLPYYGNTHTNTSVTGAQSTAFVAEARQIVAEETNARITGKASSDIILFAGSGTTAAVELLIDCLGLKYAKNSDEQRPVIFVGPYEHHSNLVPWRETGCEIVSVPECPKTLAVNYGALEKLLQKPQYNNRLKMGTFSAASNVTGNISDVNRIAAILHRHGALAFFDYATAAPYMSMDMNPPVTEGYPSSSLVAKDAIFLSPHKMIGGVGTPGVLVIKKHLVSQVNAPNKSGGGTVFYVTNTHHRFLSNRIDRYEGGTPNVAGILRVGLTFLFKRKLEQEYRKLLQNEAKKYERPHPGDTKVPISLQAYEYRTYHSIVAFLREKAPNLLLLGDGGRDKSAPNLPIFSFLIKCGSRFLHYNYVCAILNDVFGIQSRGGCQCSGPYSQRLLGLTKVTSDGEVPNEQNELIEQALLHFKERAELLRPGYTRLSLPFKGVRSDEVNYVMRALVWTAKNAWALMCNYRCNHRTGEWRHFSRQGKPLGRTERKWLSHYELPSSDESNFEGVFSERSSLRNALENALVNANCILRAARTDKRSISQALKMNDADAPSSKDFSMLEELRWYVHPKECASYLSQGLSSVPGTESLEVCGGVHPLVLRPESMEATPFPSPGHVATHDVSIEDQANSTDKKRKQANKQSCCSAWGEDSNTLGASVSVSDDEIFYFRDGEHSGEAPFSEIAEGFEEEELTGNCEVFDSQTDSWIEIDTFLRTRKKSKVIIYGSENIVNCDMTLAAVVEDRFYFRDGEEHNGEASINEIKAGFDDGELSGMAQVYSQQAGEWAEVGSFLEAYIGSRDAANTEPMLESGAAQPKNEPSSETVQDVKNEKRKPARGAGAWGGGRFVAPDTFSEADDAPKKDPAVISTKNSSSHSERSTDRLSTQMRKSKQKRFNHIKPPAKLMRQINQAIIQWNMIEEGDRLLLGLSGGKDSLSLLHCLLEAKRKLPTNFEIEVCTIDPMTPSFDPSPLIPYIESLGLQYHYIRDNIVERASKSGKDGETVSSLCAFCARMKRGNLYSCARKNNCNKLVLAQHLDDCAESFMMSVMHNGFLRTMKANYRINAGDLAVIRPMVYCRESLMTHFARNANLPVINENCPACFEEPKERARIKKLLSREESLYPNFYDNIRRSLIPLMHDDLTAILHAYTEEAVSKSRKVPYASAKEQAHQHTRNGTRASESSAVEGTAHSVGDPVATQTDLMSATEQELLIALTRKRAERFRLAGAMGRLGDAEDPTGQVCTLNGGNGSIPCRELME